MIMYTAKAASLLRSFNILVCYFILPAAMQPNKTNYIPERRLTFVICPK